MKREKRQWEDEDDGRTVADMSEVGRGGFFGAWSPAGNGNSPKPENRTQRDEEKRPVPPWEEETLTKQERRMYVLGAVKAALLIGAAYLIGIGGLIFLFLKLWGL